MSRFPKFLNSSVIHELSRLLIVRACTANDKKPFKMYSVRMKNKCETENKKNQ